MFLLLKVFLLLSCISAQKSFLPERILESGVTQLEENELAKIVDLVESDHTDDGKLDNLINNFLQTEKENEQKGKEEKEVEVTQIQNASTSTNEIILDEDSPFMSAEDLTQEEEKLIDSVKLKNSLGTENDLEKVNSNNKQENVDNIEEEMKDDESEEEVEDEEKLFEESVEEMGDKSKNLIIRSEDELINIDKTEKEEKKSDVEVMEVYSVDQNSILERIKKANMRLNYPKKQAKQIDLKRVILMILKKIKAKLYKKFYDYICTLAISEKSMKKLEERLKAHLNVIIKHAYKCIFLPEAKEKIKKLLDYYLKKCIDCEEQQECLNNSWAKIKKVLYKSLWNIVTEIWNKSVSNPITGEKEHIMVMPALGNNFGKKQIMDDTWALGRNSNPVWWRQFRKNRDMTAQNFWASHESHAREYARNNAYFDWHNRRPWKYQMNGWGRKMYSPFSHSMGWMKHERIGVPAVQKKYILRNVVKMPEDSKGVINYNPNIFVGNSFFNNCNGKQKCN
jgi:hypothetical protein